MKPTNILTLLLLMCSCTLFAQQSDHNQSPAATAGLTHQYVAGEFIVKFKSIAADQVKQAMLSESLQTGIAEIDAINDRYNINKIERVFKNLDTRHANMELAERIGITRTYLLSLPKDESIPDAVAEYATLPHVEYAEPNYIDHVALVSTDPTYELQWGLNNTGQAIPFDEGDPVGTPGADINAEAAWDLHTGDETVVLAILDTGVDYDHPEFEGRTVDGYDTFDDDDDPMDFTGHGTCCAGIAAANGDDGFGVAGVNWNCLIMPIKIGADGADVFTHADGAEGMVWAADNGADILSCSYGGTDSQTKEDGATYAYDAGCVILASRGNNNNANDYFPASYDNVISIGALSPCNDRKTPTTCDGEDWWGSSFTNLDVMAPGTRIHSADITGAGGYDDGDYHASFNGTSAACPFAAGVAALIRSYTPTLDNDEIAEAIRMSAVDIDEEGYDDNTGFGRLDAFGALNYALSLVNTPPVALCQDVAVSADENCQGSVTAAMVDNGSYDPDGDEITLTLTPEGPYGLGETQVTLTVSDPDNSATCEATITVVDDIPPELSCPVDIITGNDAGACGAVVYFTISASDNCDGAPAIESNPPTGSFFPVGTTTVVTSATDFSGNMSQCSFNVTVQDNEPPVISVNTDPIVLWPPNHKYHSFDLYDFVNSVSDNCTTLGIDDVIISKAHSDEPEDAKGNGDGKTLNDIVIGTECQSVALRSERAGELNGRVYTIFFSLTDEYGNTGMASCEVHVPLEPDYLSINDGMVYEEMGNCDFKATPLESKPVASKSRMVAYPNPFSNQTTITFLVPVGGMTTIQVFSATGNIVSTVFSGFAESGFEYTLEFQSADLPKGLYYCRMLSPEGGFITKKLVHY